MRYDAIVIGAGMSGLAAAIRLAQFDKRVVLLERHTLWGGLNSYYKLGGRRLDVGLHALTSFAPRSARGAPLQRILRQLRIPSDELQLGQQSRSTIRFPDLCLSFSNDFALLESEVGRAFPAERAAFARLAAEARAFQPSETDRPFESARAALGLRLGERRLVDALLLPTCYYGSPVEDDVDWQQFLILFQSLFLEGFARPRGGIKTLLDLLRGRYRDLRGELRLRTGVRRILLEGGAARGVELESGERLEAERVLSSAGYAETMELVGPPAAARVGPGELGTFSFLETISVLDRAPADIGLGEAVVFYCAEPRLAYRRPDGLIGAQCGVISAPSNYAGQDPAEEPQVRLTVLANPAAWDAVPEHEYAAAKERCFRAAADVARAFAPDWSERTVFRDVFTPRTIRRYTGHAGGCVYGSPVKRWSGESGVPGLILIGTDQGYLGVVGALMSGVTMANRHVLLAEPSAPRATGAVA